MRGHRSCSIWCHVLGVGSAIRFHDEKTRDWSAHFGRLPHVASLYFGDDRQRHDMYEELRDINARPRPFAYYTAKDLWTDEHTRSAQPSPESRDQDIFERSSTRCTLPK
jgi:hypothetical protein